MCHLCMLCGSSSTRTSCFRERKAEDAEKAIIAKGGEELQRAIESATVINGYKGAFKTELELCFLPSSTSSCAQVDDNCLDLVVEIEGGVKVLWQLRSKVRADGELQLGVSVSALTPAAVGCDVSISALSMNGGDQQQQQEMSWKGICLQYAAHEKRMYEGNGLLMLFPSCSSFVGPIDPESGRGTMLFSTIVTPMGAPSQQLLQLLCGQASSLRQADPFEKNFERERSLSVLSESSTPICGTP